MIFAKRSPGVFPTVGLAPQELFDPDIRLPTDPEALRTLSEIAWALRLEGGAVEPEQQDTLGPEFPDRAELSVRSTVPGTCKQGW